MGQQQLLLLVLGIVIVGLAVVVGIQAFGENQKKANSDALTNDVIRIASDAQAWALKPAAFGGGNGNFGTATTTATTTNAASVSLAKLGYALGQSGAVATAYGNLNGGYSLAVTTAGSGSTTGTITIVGCNAARGNQVQAVVNGTGPTNISTTVSNVTTCANQS